ncbi:hypothetical protein CDV36_003834 [Fusarium kuroshium]|uniref:Transcription factor domain-containing protein n=1 Tax=Fusarium kuroshium TaxID=2010991 RepID=A0A3M2SG01_9HYPO|nr:hypothetical protein CDV36_003834 [Fusarium kuroshium]
MVPFAPIADLSNLVILPEDTIDVSQGEQNYQDNSIELGTQLTLFSFPSFSLLSALSSISFTLPMDPAPSIGTIDSQAVAFHRTVLAPMKSTQVAAVSSHTLFLDFAIQNRMALHLLLAFSHSELAIHQGYSDRPPLESYLHFQHGSQLFTQQLESFMHTNHVAMMLSFLYLYMFWMRRHPFDVSRLKELSASVLVYVRAFALDELCANGAPDTGISEPVILSRILTYIYDRDVFCGFFGCGESFAGYVDENHEKRQKIWQLSRLPFSNDQSSMWSGSQGSSRNHHRMILDVYFALITIQREINRYSQGSEEQALAMGLGIKRKLERIREEQAFLFELAAAGTQQGSTTPLMALVTVTIFHALEIYLARSRDSALGELPVPSEVQRALKDLVTTAYYTVAAGPVQLLERFQWALLIAGIETHDPIHRDWISASISDPAIKGIFQLMQSAKGPSGITMRAVRRLVSVGYNNI